MALSKITFADKTALDSSPAVSEINKISDGNINEIKTVVNDGLNQVDINTTNIETLTNTLNTFMSEIYKKVYPIGAHYITSSTENPNVLFPGTTWVQITDTYIVAAGSTYKVGTAYGSNTHVHSGAVHTHTVNAHNHTSAAHTHTIASHAHTSAAHTHTIASHDHTSAAHTHGSQSARNGNLTAMIGTTNGNVYQIGYMGENNIPAGTSPTHYYIQANYYGSGGYFSHLTQVYGETTSTTPGNTGGRSLTTNSTTPNNTGGSGQLTTNSTTPGATGSTALTTNSASTANTGSASSLPPSIARYVWERTA